MKSNKKNDRNRFHEQIRSNYKKLSKLDWRSIERKLQKADLNGHSVQDVKQEGIRFLAMAGTSRKPVSPSPLVDEWWHQTILHTQFYTWKVCPIFGKYLHHHPSDGSKEMYAMNLEAFWRGLDLYEQVFGKPNLSIWGIRKKEEVNSNEVKPEVHTRRRQNRLLRQQLTGGKQDDERKTKIRVSS